MTAARTVAGGRPRGDDVLVVHRVAGLLVQRAVSAVRRVALWT
jgi:hypothetical protein